MRLIDADALKAFIRNKYFQCDMPEEWGNGVMWATSQINRYCNKEAPSVDIVRCKECRWGKPYSDKQLECDALGLGGLKFPNDFCSYGVKKGADDGSR